ncbi:Uncharacterized protein TCM_000825 [Theobroma cacao]|uniref:Uncharacterized protein n=1 Tax=Theobroma cacao TaxID=3641 RepID=A0A061DH35_THECC|nr:Uncharacterized protein TCM_000825 [Theobroma cacao]
MKLKNFLMTKMLIVGCDEAGRCPKYFTESSLHSSSKRDPSYNLMQISHCNSNRPQSNGSWLFHNSIVIFENFILKFRNKYFYIRNNYY